MNTDDRRKQLQDDLVRLSRKGTHIWAENSDHEIHLFRPDLVIQAIREVLSSAKH